MKRDEDLDLLDADKLRQMAAAMRDAIRELMAERRPHKLGTLVQQMAARPDADKLLPQALAHFEARYAQEVDDKCLIEREET